MEQQVINVSNRLPVSLEKDAFIPSSGGLISAMKSVHDTYNFSWVGSTGEQSVVPSKKKQYESQLRKMNYIPVFLEQAERKGFYDGFSNSSLWPLLHNATKHLEFKREWYDKYLSVNKKFANAILSHAKPNDIVWVHDYHFFLLPQLLKEKMSSLQVGFFLHTPFPSPEVFACNPHRDELLEGLAYSDLIGFHTFSYLHHFRNTLERFQHVESGLDSFRWKGKNKRIGVFPIGIDHTSFLKELQSEKFTDRLNTFREQLHGKKVVLAVERMDYSKGIPRKLEAIETFLEENPSMREKCRFILVAVPSRENVNTYKELTYDVESKVGRINGKYSTITNIPIHFINQSIDFSSLCALYRLADVCVVTPLADGMNLVAKEYVACQADGNGVLILSEQAGAAQELFNSLVVNPYNTNEVANAIEKALKQSSASKKENMLPMRERVLSHHSVKWANDFIRVLRKSNSDSVVQGKEGKEALKGFMVPNGKKAIFLDYDGTLREFESKPTDAIPSKQLKETIRNITSHKELSVFIISGRNKEFLEKYFGQENVTIIAEHGTMFKEHRGTWKSFLKLENLSWKKHVRKIMSIWTDVTPGTFVEEKEVGLVWHYRKADNEFGKMKATELVTYLSNVLSNHPVRVEHGNKIVEVSSMNISKGLAVDYFLEKKEYVSSLCIGDDVTDESMFTERDNKFCIKVGEGKSKAPYRVSTPEKVRCLLSQFFDK